MPTLTAPTRMERALANARPGHRALAGQWDKVLHDQAAAGMLAHRTVESYGRNIARWLQWMDLAGIAQPMPGDVLTFVAALRSNGLKAASVNAHLGAVRGLALRKDEPLEALSRDAMAALLHVMFATGLRLVSLCGLNVADFEDGDAVLAYKSKGDTERARHAYLSPGALAALNAYLEAYLEARAGAVDLDKAAPLFAAVGNRANGDRLTDRSVRRRITGLMEAAGHVHRDTALAAALNSGGLPSAGGRAAYDLREIAAWLNL